MKILVTGGTGFIGSHLTKKLIELGHEVVILADAENIKTEGAAFIKGDVRDGYDVRKAMQGCEAVFHLAAVTDARNLNEDAIYATNFLGSKNVFEVAKSKNTKIVFTSTAAVYGNSQVPNKETDECKPVSQYGKSKLRAERYLQNLTENHFIVRMFNVYGARGHSFVNTACKKITNYEDILVYGNGLQTRDYVNVSDAVDALLLGFENTGLYNVGTGQDWSVTKLIDIIYETTRCKPTVKFTTPNKNDIARSKADISRIRSLGWEPKISLEEGVSLVLEQQGFKKLV